LRERFSHQQNAPMTAFAVQQVPVFDFVDGALVV
jgi:hypothetical protein